MDDSRENSGRCSSAASSNSLSESAMFSQRIVDIDYYFVRPIRDMDVIYSDFRKSEVKQVPVIRIFGATPKGKHVQFDILFRICEYLILIPSLHLYNPRKQTNMRECGLVLFFSGQKTCTHVHCVFPYFYVPNDSSVEQLEYKLAVELDHAINCSIGNTKDYKAVQHVYKIIKVTGK